MKLSRPSYKLRRPRISKAKLIKSVIVIAALVFVVSGIAYWLNIRNKPENIFWSMLDNSLQTRSVIRKAPRDTSANQPEQTLLFVTSPQQAVHGSNKYFQSGDNLEPTLVTEVLGTAKADYVRVRNLTPSTPGQAQPDISSFKDVWADTDDGSGSGGQLFYQAALNVIPIGYLNHDQRATFLQKLKDSGAYKINQRSIKRISYTGRPAYSMNVSVNTESYVRVFKDFAQETGLTELASLNPDDYKGTKPIDMQIAIDIISKQLIVIYQPANSQTTAFSGYGIRSPRVQMPTKTIPIQELQSRIQTVR